METNEEVKFETFGDEVVRKFKSGKSGGRSLRKSMSEYRSMYSGDDFDDDLFYDAENDDMVE